MRKLLVVGIGAGNPEHMTIEAINALNTADALFIPLKGPDKADLAELRREIVARFVTNPSTRTVAFDVPMRDATNPSYEAGVGDWHEAIAHLYARLLANELGDNRTGAFLVWGDPSLYDSTLRILDRVRAAGLDFELRVVPGISSLHALTAAHATTLNRIGEPVLISTGRRVAETSPATDVAVLLDGRLAFTTLDGEAYDIYWGAYLGTPDQILIAGRLADVAPEIVATRAAARERHGWIMDTYLLRRRDPADTAGSDDKSGGGE